MSQGFDKSKPVLNSALLSPEILTNFNASVNCHAGIVSPSDPDEGWIWLNTSASPVYTLWMYLGGAWYLILNNLTAGFPSNSTVNRYTHTQVVASATWTITHSLGSRNLNFAFWDITDVLMFPQSVTQITNNQSVAVFLVAKAGRAVVLG